MANPPPDPLYVIRGEIGAIHCLMFQTNGPDVEHLYAGAQSGSIHVWDLKKNREIQKFGASNDACLSILDLDNQTLITQPKGGGLEIWNASNSSWTIGKSIKTDFCGYCRFQRMSSKTCLIPLNDSKMAVFSSKTLKTEIELNPSNSVSGPIGQVMSMKTFSDDGNLAMAVYDGGKLLLWDLRAKKVLSSLNTIDSCPLTVDFDEKSSQGVVGNPTNEIEVFLLTPETQLVRKKTISLINAGISHVAIRPDKKILATGGWDTQIRLFSWKTLKQLVILDIHKSTIHDIAYSRSKIQAYNAEHLMAVADKDGVISLWDLYGQKS